MVKKVRWLIFISFLFSNLVLLAQAPNFEVRIENETRVSASVYEFDIKLYAISPTISWEMSGFSAGIGYNTNWSSSGTFSATLISGTSDMNTVPNQVPVSINTTTSGVVKISSTSSPGSGNGTIINQLGKRLIRVRLSTTTSFQDTASPNLYWTLTSALYPTSLSAYIGGTNVIIASNSTTTANGVTPSNNVSFLKAPRYFNGTSWYRKTWSSGTTYVVSGTNPSTDEEVTIYKTNGSVSTGSIVCRQLYIIAGDSVVTGGSTGITVTNKLISEGAIKTFRLELAGSNQSDSIKGGSLTTNRFVCTGGGTKNLFLLSNYSNSVLDSISITGNSGIVVNPSGSLMMACGAVNYVQSGSSETGINTTLVSTAITTQPISVTQNSGGSVSFSVTATGSGSLTYQWYKDAVIIPGATSNSISLPSISPSDSGNYTVKITGLCGQVTSNNAKLTVNFLNIITQPAATTICQGSNYTLSVSAQGNGTLTYQWQKNGVNIAGATGATYLISGASVSDSGTYSVNISNGVLNVSSSTAKITVYSNLVIQSQPVNFSQQVGTTATFKVVVTGGGNVVFQWLKNSIPISGASDSIYTINNVTVSDSGLFSCKITATCPIAPQTTVPAKMSVKFLQITSQTATPQSICVGGNLNLSVTASSNFPITYQWKKNGTNITSANASTFSITNVAISDSGDYRVFLANGVDTLSGGIIKVNVLSAPSITTQPVSQTVVLGSSVTLSVGVSGGGTLNYQWKKNNVNIASSNSPTYTIAAAAKSDSGDYTCVITGICGTVTTATATLKVNYITISQSPTLITQPCDSTNVTFFVTASSNSVFTYQWKKNGVAIPGATSSAFSINPVTNADTGKYYVTITNAYQSVNSDSVVLTLRQKPFIVTQPLSQSINAGATLTLTTSVTGYAPLTYQWKKDGVALSIGPRIASVTNSSLVITNVNVNDSGDYTVVISNGCTVGLVPPRVSNAATIKVNYITINTQPSNKTACVGTSVTLSVAAIGSGTVSYQWKRNGVDLVGANASTLTINPVNYSDSGTYTVYINNGTTPVTSGSAYLTVPITASLSSLPSLTSKSSGSNFTYSVTASGSGPFTYQWKKNNIAISGQTTSTLNLTNVSPSDSGIYTCDVTGPCGTIATNQAAFVVIYLTINTNPVDLIKCQGDSAIFSCSASGSGIITYQWRKNGNPIAGATSSTYIIPSVLLGDSGYYSCAISNTSINKTTNTAYLQVNYNTVITTQPVNTIGFAGTNLSLFVVATGSGTLTYKWYKNGVLIPSATGSSLPFTPLTNTDSGNYYVVISGACNPVTSIVARLDVNYLQIQTQPGSRTLCEGSVDSLYVNAIGSGTVTYQWYKRSTLLSGKTNKSLVFNPVLSTDTGVYSVKVSNGVNSDIVSNAVTVTVNAKTKITAQPVSITKNIGQAASFVVTASGSGILTYQWYHNGTLISGATSVTYSIPSVALIDSGTYTVKVNGTCGFIFSDTVRLNVNYLQVTTQPVGTTVCEGNNVQLSVNAIGFGNIHYQWMKNGVDILGDSGLYLNFLPISPSDSAIYKVRITNGVSTIYSDSVLVNVQRLIQIKTQPLSANVNAGSAYTFHIGFTGTGPFTFQWYKNSTSIFQANDSVYSIASVVAGDSGNYTVRITGVCGNTTSNIAVLKVNFIKVTTQPASQNVCTNTAINLSIVTSANGPLTYQWYYNGNPITGATASSYIKNNPSLSDSGSYYVKVTNGTFVLNSNVAKVTVALGPTYITQPQNITQNQGTNVTFNPSVSGSPTLTYQWYKNGVLIPGATSMTLQINNVSTTDIGKYNLTAKNSCGTVSSDTAQLNLNIISIVKQPVNSSACEGTALKLSVYAISNQSITYQWKMNGIDIPGAIDSVYLISNLSFSDTGSYSVTINSSTLSTQSNVIKVNIKARTKIDVQPVDVSQQAGTSASFSVTASGSGNLTFKWLKNGVYITNATASTFTINSISGGDAGDYSVDVTGDCGTVRSTPAKLFVKGTTVKILKHPISQQLCFGSLAYFSVVASGKGTLNYQWKKDGLPISGANKTELYVSNITAAEAAGYSVMVNDDSDTALSQTALLTVYDLPSSRPISGPNTASLTSSPLAYSLPANPSNTYLWTINGGIIVSGQNQNSIFVKWNKAGVGKIQVKVTNQEHGCSDTSTYLVNVNSGSGAVFETMGIRQMDVYPNPNSGKFIVDLELTQNSSVHFQLIDLAGKVCLDETLHHHSGKQSFNLESHAQSGMYILSTEINGHVIYQRISIQ